MTDSLFRIQALARLTIIDGIKRHALVGLIIFAIAGEICGLLFFDLFPRDLGRASTDFHFSISFAAGLIFLFVHAVQVTAWGDEHRSMHTYLARPISRAEYVLGTFCGLAFLLLLLNILLGGIGWGLLQVIKNSIGGAYFDLLSPAIFVFSVIGVFLIELTILSVIVFFASTVRGNFPVTLLTLAYYCICTALPVVRESVRQQTISAQSSGDLLSLVLQIMTGVFPDFSKLDLKVLVIGGVDSSVNVDMYSVISATFLYIVVVLYVSTFSFKKRDLV